MIGLQTEQNFNNTVAYGDLLLTGRIPEILPETLQGLIPINQKMKRYLFMLILIITALTPITCSQVQPKDISGNESPANEILNNMKKYQEVVEKISGRKFKTEVKGKIQSVEEFRDYVKKDIDNYFNEKGKWRQVALSKLGLLPGDYNLRQGLENLVVSQAGAYYDPQSKCMYIVKINMPPMEIEIMLIHEMVHALQDQYYNLEKLIKQADNDDQEAAIKYLVEGEATYIMTIAQLEKMGITFAPDSPMLDISFSRYKNMGRKELLELSMAQAESYKKTAPDLYESLIALKDTPDYLFWTLNAPYFRGACSIHSLVTIDAKERNWRTIEDAYRNPPVSTEQMIHPKKLTEPRDNPEPLSSPNLGADWTILSENTLGELGFWILFSNAAEGKADEASEGWDGDKYILMQHNKTKDIVLYLSTVWDSDNDAYESFRAYHKVLTKLYPSAKIEESGKDKQEITYSLPDNNRIVLTRKNNTWSAQEILAGQDYKDKK